MKTAILILLTLVPNLLLAQGQIIDLRIEPAQPSTSDNVLLIADVEFPYSDCEQQDLNFELNDFNLTASAHHCLGILNAFCNTTDTIELGQLEAGSYSTLMSLTSGVDSACTPGFAADTAHLSFEITDVIASLEPLPNFSIKKQGNLLMIESQNILDQVDLINLNGQMVNMVNYSEHISTVDLAQLPHGMYIVQARSGTMMTTQKFMH